ncbi:MULTISPECIES: antibiotic biosynthesis monooxygenase [Streptomyces]|uniref:Antibiotic biosynthesis monooxygenase n=2 Tax=Streptomyces TaxID=1883 RepID=A0A1V0U7J0_STRVN|nr:MULTISPECIES: antibiotic biosynthesis monooxygenase [Streptomyces]ARF61077.1 antibiotic biosynthesis monooxygenase [Streptomyces violaceoruber]QRV27014.1 antibiotic biosynthesis monooxygenase [Streptomyces californicus]QRV37323.1 antibiotic biosynthesis monooxygenase [Streptomyces californicus]QRV40415.1 antibiotic biosynthesis monooxygenase [Streptomyces californicus]QRV47165.1 antibiotic biosynthesis monooxygenase [Streptomyces californicus]
MTADPTAHRTAQGAARPAGRPDPARPDAAIAKASTWNVGTPQRQREAVDAIRKVWESREWPHPGLLSYSVYTGEDGATLLHYSQWTGEQAYQELVRDSRDARNAEIDAAVPGIERVGIQTYEHYRSGLRAEGDTRETGCVVIVDVEFAGPDRARQRDWVDSVFEALAEETGLPAGGIAAHFHTSTDGTRVLNYAEWESAGHHIAALAAPGEGVGSPSPLWERVQKYPGMTGGGVNRYTPALSLEPASEGQSGDGGGAAGGLR